MVKVFERIVYDQLYHYLNEIDLLSQHQSGFRSLYSTVTALIEATDNYNWSLNIDRGFIDAVVFLGLKKAFDAVGHTTLLSKLPAYGISRVPQNNGSALICITSDKSDCSDLQG